MGHEVVDLDDQWMLYLRKELLLHDRDGKCILVSGVEQALQNHPTIGHIVIFGEVNPAKAAVRQTAGYLVLVRYQITGLQLRGKGEGVPTLRAEAFGASRLPIARPTNGRPAVRTVPFFLRDLRILHDR